MILINDLELIKTLSSYFIPWRVNFFNFSFTFTRLSKIISTFIHNLSISVKESKDDTRDRD